MKNIAYTISMAEKDLSLIAFLKSTNVFIGIADSELADIISLFKQYDINAGEKLFEVGDTTEGFFFIFDGEAVIIEQSRGEVAERLILNKGDFTGEEAMFFLPKRNNTVFIKLPSKVLYISNKDIAGLLNAFPQIRENLSVLSESRMLSQRLSFSWLSPDEEIHVISRKHPIMLLGGILIPLFCYIGLVLLLFLLANVWQAGAIFMLLLLSVGFVLSSSWLAWNVYNWSNDYYILTNQRMVWIEKVAGVFDSRQEAPLITLKTVGTSKSLLGNLFGFADVTVRTFVGPISFRKVANAPIIAEMIQSLWIRSKQEEMHDEYGKMQEVLQRKLSGEALSSELVTESNNLETAIINNTPEVNHESTFFQWLFADFLKLRFEKGNIITYRKHWLILLKNIWQPFFLLAAAIIIGSLVLTNNFSFISDDLILIISGIVLVGASGWLLYNYIDWRNDIYQLSDEQIIDTDRKPLGKENRRTAPLDSILSIEHERKGLLAILFNYGTVLIAVGNTELSFDFVSHPSEVQQDIFARMGINQETKRRKAIDQERERMAEWLKVYHDQTESQRIQNQSSNSAIEPTQRLDKNDN